LGKNLATARIRDKDIVHVDSPDVVENLKGREISE
jgi:hypothetical protein